MYMPSDQLSTNINVERRREFHICDEVVTAVSMLIAKTMINILIDNLKILLTSIDKVTYLWEDHRAR